jgi:CheY-like chemotaxis protein
MVYLQSLRKLGYTDVECVGSAEEALAAVECCQPKLILLDIKLRGERDGITVAEIIRQRFDIPVVFITAYSDPDTLRRARLTRPFHIIGKTGDNRELERTVAEVMSAGCGYSRKTEKIHL